MLIGVVVVFKWKQRRAGHIAYWQQQRAVEQHKGEAASQLPDSQARRQKMDRAKASALSRLAESAIGTSVSAVEDLKDAMRASDVHRG